ARLGAEPAAANVVHLELDDRAFAGRTLRRPRVGQILARDDRLRIDEIERAVPLALERRGVRGRQQRLARRHRGLHRGVGQEIIEQRYLIGLDVELAGHPTLLEQARERAAWLELE